MAYGLDVLRDSHHNRWDTVTGSQNFGRLALNRDNEHITMFGNLTGKTEDSTKEAEHRKIEITLSSTGNTAAVPLPQLNTVLQEDRRTTEKKLNDLLADPTKQQEDPYREWKLNQQLSQNVYQQNLVEVALNEHPFSFKGALI